MSKKRRTKASIRRSNAAKKGWETRRKKAKELERKSGIRAFIKKRGIGNYRQHIAGLTPKQAKKKIAADRKALKKAAKEKQISKATLKRNLNIADIFETFVTDAEPSEIRADGSIAAQSSRLRMLPKEDKSRLWQEMQEMEGDPDFDLYMYGIADDYEVEVREVYTFFFSP